MNDKPTFIAVLTVALLVPVAAAADPITAAVATFLGVSATTAAIIVRIGFSLVLSSLSSALRKNPGQQRQPGIKTDSTTSGGSNPQSFILGTYATAGNMVAPPYSHPNDGDIPNKWLTYVVDISDMPGVQFSRIMVAGEYVTDLEEAEGLTHDLRGMLQDDGGYYFRMTWHDGTQTAADAYMLENYSDHPDRPWSADMVGTGVTYAVLTFHYSRKLFNQLPGVRFEVKGIPLYDPRKDDTAGGAGAHRWNDPATWEFTGNPIVMTYNILRGLTLPDGQRWGGHAAAADLPLDNWFAGMNECDVSVPLADGGSEPQYLAGLEVLLDDEPADVIGELLKACSADISEFGGTYKVRVGPPALPVYFFTDDDVVADRPQSLAPYPGLDGVHNAIHATHPDPESLWEQRDAPPRYNDEWESEDGGRQLVAQVDLPAVSSGTQVQRLMKAWIEDERRFRRHSLSLPPDAALLEPLDTVAWTSAREGYSSKVFEVGELTDDLTTCLQTLALRERDAGDFTWVPATDEVAVEHPSTAVTVVAPRTLSGFNLLAHSLADGGGEPRRPALRPVWGVAPLEPGDLVEWQVQLADGTAVANGTAMAADGEVILSAGILPETAYRGRARLLSLHGGAWTDWDTVVTGAVRFGLGDIDQDALEAIQDDAAASAAALDNLLVIDRIDPLEAEVKRDLEIRDVQSFHTSEALGVIGDQVLWALTKVSEIDGRIADAGIFEDPETGTVRIYGIEAEAERISEAEIRLSAAEASISLSATQAWVNQQISNAVLDPSQIPVVDDLQVRVNQVEADLDAAEAAIALTATQTEVDGMEARLTSAEADIDAAGAAIGLKVDQAEFDAAESRLSTAELQISTLEGPSITQTVSDVRTMHDQLAAQDVATLEQLLLAYEQREALKRQIAYATQDIRARVEDDRSAMAAITASLGVAIDNSVALIEAEKLVRASGDDALASTIDALEVRLDGDIAAQSTVLSALTTRVTDAEGAITSQSQSMTSLDSRLTTAEGNISGQATAVSQLDTRVADAEGNISSQATAITTLQSAVGGNSASIQQTMQTVNGVMGEYTLRIDNNGHVSGMVVRSDLDDQGEPASEVAFQSDMFAIVSADGSQKRSPFVVYTEDTMVGGVLVPAGVYMRKAAIRNGSIGNAEIAGSLQSDNYAEDADGIPTEGVKIDFRNDVVKLAGPVISRNIEAAAGSFWTGGPITVDPNSGLYQVETWELVETGLQVPVDQVWMASNKTYLAYAAFDGSATAPGGISGNSEYWGCKAEVLPFARWNGPQQLYLRIELWAKGISALHRSGNTTLGGKIHWKLYEVT